MDVERNDCFAGSCKYEEITSSCHGGLQVKKITYNQLWQNITICGLPEEHYVVCIVPLIWCFCLIC